MSAASLETSSQPTVTIRSLQESDLAEANTIFRLAFGTFLGLPDPQQFAADSKDNSHNSGECHRHVPGCYRECDCYGSNC